MEIRWTLWLSCSEVSYICHHQKEPYSHLVSSPLIPFDQEHHLCIHSVRAAQEREEKTCKLVQHAHYMLFNCEMKIMKKEIASNTLQSKGN